MNNIGYQLGKVKRHIWMGLNLGRCEKCGEEFSSVVHK